MLQLLQQYEHLATHLAQAVELIVNTFGVKAIVSEIMRYSCPSCIVSIELLSIQLFFVRYKNG